MEVGDLVIITMVQEKLNMQFNCIVAHRTAAYCITMAFALALISTLYWLSQGRFSTSLGAEMD